MAWRLYGSGTEELKRCYRTLRPAAPEYECVNALQCFFRGTANTCLAPFHMGRSPLAQKEKPAALRRDP